MSKSINDSLRLEHLGAHTIGVRDNDTLTTKKTILCVHGIGTSGSYFIPLADELASDYHVILLDLPGYGRALKPDQPLTLIELAAVVDAYLVKHDLHDIVIVGHSMGCQIIAHLPHIDPDRIERIIMISPTANDHERHLLLQGARLLQDACVESPQTNLALIRGYFDMGFHRYLQTARWMIADCIEDQLRDTHTPTLLIRGTRDCVVPARWIRKLERLAVAIRYEELVGLPHALQFSNATEVAAVCRSFINR